MFSDAAPSSPDDQAVLDLPDALDLPHRVLDDVDRRRIANRSADRYGLAVDLDRKAPRLVRRAQHVFERVDDAFAERVLVRVHRSEAFASELLLALSRALRAVGIWDSPPNDLVITLRN